MVTYEEIRLPGYQPVRPLGEGLAHAIDWYVAKLAPRRSAPVETAQLAAAISGTQSNQSIATPTLSWRARSWRIARCRMKEKS